MLVIAALEEEEFGESFTTVCISSPSLAMNWHCRCSTRRKKTPRSSTEFVEDINEKRPEAPRGANFQGCRNRSILYPRLCTQGMMASSNLRRENIVPLMNISFPE
jgi:hypothetical protein